MKSFLKRSALVTGLLFAALICCGVVYIDNVKHYLATQSDGYTRLYVNDRFIFGVHTNTGSFGLNVTNAGSLARTILQGQGMTNKTSGNGQTSATTGRIDLTGAAGGNTSDPTTASGGNGGSVVLTSGAGGEATAATTNSTGGNAANVTMAGGTGGGSQNTVATNTITGGSGGTINATGGAGGSPSVSAAPTNAVGGTGGSVNFTAGAGGTPGGGWSRKTGNGGSVALAGGNSGNSTRTNSGDGGSLSFTAGNSGNVTTTPGNPGTAGAINLTAGNGGTGDTNANGGSVYAIGGDGGSTAADGDVVLARNVAGTSRGGLMVGPLTANAASLTNLLQATATLDFGSVAAGAVLDLPITVANAADGDVVSLAVPIASVTNCMWMAWASNGAVYVRAANTQPVTAQDPNSGVFRVSVSKFR